ncbi:MAG TPA: hypothetical protein VK104_02030, partial [Burkholderiaceae bacterium]|nr:hypothetical protein [Burkholderiaceae bacterium]
MSVNEIVLLESWLLASAFAAGMLVSAIVLGWRSVRLKRLASQLRAERDDAIVELARMEAYADSRQHEARELEQTRLQLTHDFRRLADQLLQEKSSQFAISNEASLGSLLRPFREQIE